MHAISYDADSTDPEHTQTFTNLKSRIKAAAASDAFAGKRIANPSGLIKSYLDMATYSDITPGDDKTETFTPAQLPPIPPCATDTAVTNSTVNRALVRDCSTLLGPKETRLYNSATQFPASGMTTTIQRRRPLNTFS